METKNTEKVETKSILKTLGSPEARAMGVGALMFLTLYSFGLLNLKLVIYTMFSFLAFEFTVAPVVISRVYKSGNFQYTFEDLHKFLSLAFVLAVGFLFFDAIIATLVNRVLFAASFLFVLEYTFKISEAIQGEDTDGKYTEGQDGLTDDAKEILDAIEKGENDLRKSPLSERIVIFLRNQKYKIDFSITLLSDIVFGRKENLKKFEDLNKVFGMDEVAKNATFKDIFKATYKRYLVNIVLTTLVITLILT